MNPDALLSWLPVPAAASDAAAELPAAVEAAAGGDTEGIIQAAEIAGRAAQALRPVAIGAGVAAGAYIYLARLRRRRARPRNALVRIAVRPPLKILAAAVAVGYIWRWLRARRTSQELAGLAATALQQGGA